MGERPPLLGLRGDNKIFLCLYYFLFVLHLLNALYLHYKITDMKDLQKLITAKKLDKNALAKTLFPDAKFPRLTLNRVLNGERELTAQEYRDLSELSGIPLGYLVADEWHLVGGTWHYTLLFRRGEFKCNLNTKHYALKVYKFTEGVYTEVKRTQVKNEKISTFMSTLNEIIFNL